MIVVATHHKTGTVLMNEIFGQVCRIKGWKFFYGRQEDLPEDADLFFQDHSRIDPEALPAGFKGIHVIRHPMEVVVSGYRYHHKTCETWCSGIERVRFGEMTHQGYLKTLSQSEGITFEMVETGYRTINEMYDWDYEDDRFLNLHLEAFAECYEDTLRQAFAFLGFEEDAIRMFLAAAKAYNKRGSNHAHITNKTEVLHTYEDYFEPYHYTLFQLLFPDDLFERLGYEKVPMEYIEYKKMVTQ